MKQDLKIKRIYVYRDLA